MICLETFETYFGKDLILMNFHILKYFICDFELFLFGNISLFTKIVSNLTWDEVVN